MTTDCNKGLVLSGFFITFEGGEGGGKSTQIKALAQHLKKKGYDVIVTREPGGTVGGEAVRHVLLSGLAEKYGSTIEAVLFAAARADHVDELIEPALNAGKVVLCDRFIDSTRVYQGNSTELSNGYVEILEKAAINGHMPDLTFILDIPASEGMERAGKRRGKEQQADRFEKDAITIQEQRRQTFLKIAKHEPHRCHIIDATQQIEEVTYQITDICDMLMDKKRNATY